MGPIGTLASSRIRFTVLATAAAILASAPLPARGASYTSRSWFLTGAFGYQVVNPTELNDNLESFAASSPKLHGLIGMGIEIERGLKEPDFSHWMQFGYHLSDVSATVAIDWFIHS